MNAIQKFLGLIKNILTTSLFPSDTVHITIGTVLLIIAALIFVSYLLKLIKKIVNAKLPEEDKNKFTSIFCFSEKIIMDPIQGYAVFSVSELKIPNY